MNKAAFKFLIIDKESKSKLSNLEYQTLGTQKYLLSDKISTRKKKLSFRTRTRMLKVGDNFGKKDEYCPLCLMAKNDQKHIIDCLVVKLQCKQISENKDIMYSDIFSNNSDKINSIISLIDIALRKREQILNINQSVSYTHLRAHET